MATTNEVIRDALVARQVDLLRFSAGFGDRLVRALNRGEPALRQRILRILQSPGRSRGATRVVTQRIDRVLASAGSEWDEVRGIARTELLELGRAEERFARELIEGALPVPVTLQAAPAGEISSAVLSEPFNGLVFGAWLSGVRSDDRSRLVRNATVGRTFEESAPTTLRRLFGRRSLGGTDGERETTRRALKTFSRSAVSHVSTSAYGLLFLANRRAIRRELFVAVLDGVTTPICRSLDGRTFRVSRGPKPPIHHSCRSLRAPVIEGRSLTLPVSLALEGELAGLRGRELRRRVGRLVGGVPGGLTYTQWLERQTVAAQDEILGRTRARLWRRGELSLGAFVDSSGKLFTLEELAARVPAAFRAANVPLPS